MEEGFILAAVMLSMSGLGQSLSHQIFTSVCLGRALWGMCSFPSAAFRAKAVLKDILLGLLVFFLSSLSATLVHLCISAEEPAVEFRLWLKCYRLHQQGV